MAIPQTTLLGGDDTREVKRRSAGPGVGWAAALQVRSVYDITKAHGLEIQLYSNKQKLISLDRTVGELENIAGSKSKVSKRFLERQAGWHWFFTRKHSTLRGRHDKAEETAVQSLTANPELTVSITV